MFIYTYIQQKHYRGFPENWHVAVFKMPARTSIIDDIRSWCYNAFGRPGYFPLTDEFRWNDDIFYGEVQFSRKEDLEWFLLRWS